MRSVSCKFNMSKHSIWLNTIWAVHCGLFQVNCTLISWNGPTFLIDLCVTFNSNFLLKKRLCHLVRHERVEWTLHRLIKVCLITKFTGKRFSRWSCIRWKNRDQYFWSTFWDLEKYTGKISGNTAWFKWKRIFLWWRYIRVFFRPWPGYFSAYSHFLSNGQASC